MAEKTILVCDVCGQPATHTVTILIGGRRLLKDYCDAHTAELRTGARAAGRSRSAPAASKGTKKGRAAPRARPSRRRTRPANGTQVAAEVRTLRDAGMTYRQIGEALLAKGIKPLRAEAWNPIVIGRMLKRQAG